MCVIELASSESKRKAALDKIFAKSQISCISILCNNEKNGLWKLCPSPCSVFSIISRTVKVVLTNYNNISGQEVSLFKLIGRTSSVLKEVSVTEKLQSNEIKDRRNLIDAVVYCSKVNFTALKLAPNSRGVLLPSFVKITVDEVLHMCKLLKSTSMEQFIANNSFIKKTNHNIRKIFGAICEKYHKLDELLRGFTFEFEDMRNYMMLINSR